MIDAGSQSGDHTYIDLFAGCGGLSLGLHEAGWRGLFAVERDPMAFETLSQNMLEAGARYPGFDDWPDWLPKRNLTIEEVLQNAVDRQRLADLRGQVDLVAGGPPCQGFSVGGIRDGADKRNHLVKRMLDVVSLVRPRLVLIENVEGITKRFVSKPGVNQTSVADYVVDSLSASYNAGYVIVDASRFGVPQLRRRVLIIGIDKQEGYESPIEPLIMRLLEQARERLLRQLRLPADRPVTVGEAIGDLAGADEIPCPDSAKFSAGPYRVATSAYARLMRRGVLVGEPPDSHRFAKHSDRILAFYRNAQRQPRGRLSKEFLIASGTKKDKVFVLDPAAPASTVTTLPEDFIHHERPRNLTVREMARLQSFPDAFHFYGRYTMNGPRRRYDVARVTQVGNAVPPLLAQVVGAALIDLLESRTDRTREAEVSPRTDLAQQLLSV